MLCENCRERPATIHETLMINGTTQATHLCERCLQERAQSGGGMVGGFAFPNLSIHQLLSSFLGQDVAGGTYAPSRPQQEPRCRSCGMTYSEFADSGRLGCAQCYEELEPYLSPLIKRIQGTDQHAGKMPKRTGGVARQKRELSTYKKQLASAVTAEQFEEAARLRDRIKQMELDLQAGGGSGVVE